MKKNDKEKFNLTVTPEAVEKIISLMAENGLKDHYLRIFLNSLGCSGNEYGMAFTEEPREGDISIESNGICVLVDSFSILSVNGTIVDYVDTPDGPDFRICNPDDVGGSACSSCDHHCQQN
jgi:iron-sulfur cluster assembly accessory protein